MNSVIAQEPTEPERRVLRRRNQIVQPNENEYGSQYPPPNIAELDPPDMQLQLQLLKDVANYQTYSLVVWSIIGGILPGWIYLLFSDDTFDSFPIISTCVGLGFVAIVGVCTRPDIQVAAPFPFPAFTIPAAQCLIIAHYSLILMITFEPNAFDVFQFKDRLKDHIYAQLENGMSLYRLWKICDLWFRINMHLFFISYTFLHLIDVPCTFYRMSKNLVLREILVFEMYAQFLPIAYILIGFLITNTLATQMPEFMHTGFTWTLIYALLVLMLLMVFVLIIWYIEMPIPRPQGLPGQFYMMEATMVQEAIGLAILGFYRLGTAVYFQSGPGYPIEPSPDSDIYSTAVKFYSQIWNNVPFSEWKIRYPFPYSFYMINTVIFIALNARFLALDIHLAIKREMWSILRERALMQNVQNNNQQT